MSELWGAKNLQKDRKLFSEGKLKKRYKMYKAGKSWVAAPLVFFSLGAFSLGVTPVKADQAQDEPQKAVDRKSTRLNSSHAT